MLVQLCFPRHFIPLDPDSESGSGSTSLVATLDWTGKPPTGRICKGYISNQSCLAYTHQLLLHYHPLQCTNIERQWDIKEHKKGFYLIPYWSEISSFSLNCILYNEHCKMYIHYKVYCKILKLLNEFTWIYIMQHILVRWRENGRCRKEIKIRSWGKNEKGETRRKITLKRGKRP